MADTEDDQKKSLWRHTATPAPATETLNGEQKTDVLVIGGGYTGLSTALHLALAGKSATVLEAKTIGHGGSGRNSGLLNAGVWIEPEGVEKRIGRAAGEKLNNALKFAPAMVFDLVNRYQMNCDAMATGTLHLAVSEATAKYLKERGQQLNARGAETYMISGTESQRLSGSSHYRYGALVDPKAGTIQPLSYARCLAQAALQEGARIFEDCPVQSLRRDNGIWHAQCPGGSVSAETVIMATNAYSDAMLPGAKEATTPLYIFHVATGTLPEDVARSITPEQHGAWDTRKALVSTRIDRDNRLVISTLGNLTRPGASLRRDWITRVRDRLYPQAKGRHWEFEWTGRTGFTANNLPRLHQPAPNLFLPLGYNGRGISPGTALGKASAELAITGDVNAFPLPLQPFQPDSFRTPREAFYEFGTLLYQTVDHRI